MAAAITQKGRLLRLTTPLGEDVLLADHVVGIEGLSRPFHFEVTCLSVGTEQKKVDAKKLLGEKVSLAIHDREGTVLRQVHGMVRRFRTGAAGDDRATFHLEIVPAFALLDLTSDCRIFQFKSIPDVVAQVLKEAGVDHKLQLTRSYTTLDYCVQYRETDYNFVSRLLEQEGISYFFEHAENRHVMVLSDGLRAGQPAPAHDKPVYFQGGGGTSETGLIDLWEERSELFPGKWTLSDYHFENPRNSPTPIEEAALKPAAAVSKLEMFDFPGEYAQRFNKPGERLAQIRTEGESTAKVRMEAAEGGAILAEGASDCAGFVPGFKITPTTRVGRAIKGTWVLASVQHSASQAPAYFGTSSEEAGTYRNRFSCVPEDAKYRPLRVSAKPVIQGPQSARVIDESSSGDTEEIWPDKFGRVRVRFPWDREAKNACWVRVAQQRAGKSGGFIWIPRVGDEVLVAFMEGDPDCPVIVGSVYNADNPALYKLPDNKTQSGIKTRSSPKGGADNFNEIRFEDKKGSEEIFVQAEKNLTTKVKVEEARTVGAGRTTTIEKDEVKTINQGDEKITLKKGSQTIKVYKDQSTTIDTGKCALEVSQGDHTVEVKMGNQSTEIAMGNQATKVKMGNITTEASMGNISTQAKLGNITIKADVGKITIEALQGIELKVGTNSIKIDMMGITVKGMMATVEGQVQTSVKGLMTKVDGSAMLMAKGAITMIG